ncbi:MAG: phosphatase PAP2 family protein [Chthoniobacterales bacterium]|nr:phosphatase PAP2 family protein [Chthoniobacterales bacterium]
MKFKEEVRWSEWGRRLVVFGKWFLVVGIALWIVWFSFIFDDSVRRMVLEWQGDSWRGSRAAQFWGAVSKYGDWPQLFVTGSLLLVLALVRRKRRAAEVIAAAIVASTLTGIIANGSRLTTGRVRPRDEAKLGAGFFGPWHEGRLTVGVPGYNSFPSGHAATAFGFASPVFFAVPWVGLVLMVGAVMVAMSRVMLGAHHLSDIVVSLLLALFIGYMVLRWFEGRGGKWLDRLMELLAGGWRPSEK